MNKLELDNYLKDVPADAIIAIFLGSEDCEGLAVSVSYFSDYKNGVTCLPEKAKYVSINDE